MKKIPSLFVRDFGGDPRFVLPQVNPECEWVQQGEGVATKKWDGTACLVREGQLFKRFDAKRGKLPPVGWEPCQEPDPNTGHCPGWVAVSPDKPEDKWFRAASPGADVLVDGTYELCGPHFQGNPEKFDHEVLVAHGQPILEGVPTTFDELKKWFEVNVLEGVVWHHPDGRMAKIKRTDFGLPWGSKK